MIFFYSTFCSLAGALIPHMPMQATREHRSICAWVMGRLNCYDIVRFTNGH